MPESQNAESSADAEISAKPRHLVRYDYGMGGLLWWIHAASATEILESLAGVEVLTDPDAVRGAESQDLKTVDLGGPLPVPLSGMRAERIEQQTMAGFGALVGRERVYLGWTSPAGSASGVEGGPVRTLVELGADGRVLRQVGVGVEVGTGDAVGIGDANRDGGGEIDADGTTTAVRASDEEHASQPPFDLYDPQYAAMEIDAATFEDAWARSR